MLTLTAADTLLITWAWWSSDDGDLPKMPGNNWHWLESGYRKSAPSYSTDDMCAVDAAVAALRRDCEPHWLVLRAHYVQRKRRSERKLEAALRQFCAVY